MPMPPTDTSFTHVKNRWDHAEADALDPVDTLVYRSNLLGESWRITNTGGGNTSSKVTEEDPLTGEEVEVLWVKGSGGDLRTAERANFASLYQEKLLALQDVYFDKDERGVKSVAEDEMTDLFAHCTFDLNPRAPSIDTPLHSFIPHAHVDHTHPVAVIAIATAENSEELTKEIYGDELAWIDWQRPGFELGLQMQRVCEERPEAKGIVMGGHGLINWAPTQKACYERSLALIDRAEEFLQSQGKKTYGFGGARHEALPREERREMLASLLPWLRGQVSQERRFIGTVQATDDVLDFVGSEDAERLAEKGTSCPDHFLRTKIKPLYVNWDPQTGSVASLKETLAEGLEDYRADYRAYYETCSERDPLRSGDEVPDMRDPNPTVILIPGLGMITWGKSKSESRVTAEFYRAAIEVMKGAEAVSKYTAISRQEAYDIEYWRLEIAKLERQPPEEEFSRRIVAVVGAGSGIGRALAGRLAEENATLALLDLDAESAEAVAEDIQKEVGFGIGVAGSGISGGGPALGLECDVTDRASVQKALDDVALAYGGLDHVTVTAGLYTTTDAGAHAGRPVDDGHDPDADWDRSFAVNTKGVFVAADEATRVMREQDLPGTSMVMTTSANAVVPKSGSFAYDTSKAAANHLIRELAVELAPLGRVNGVAPATVVEGSSMFPRERVLRSLDKYGLDYQEEEETPALRERLAEFYAERTLTKRPITPAHQAEAIYVLLSGDRLGQTTGQILAVDGGIKEAFLR